MCAGTRVQINLRLLFNYLCIFCDGQLSAHGHVRSGTDGSLVMAKICELLLIQVPQQVDEGG